MSIYGTFLESQSNSTFNTFSTLYRKPITGLIAVKPQKHSEIKKIQTAFLKGEPIAGNEFSGLGQKLINNIPSHINLSLREDAMLMEGLFSKKKKSTSKFDLNVLGRTTSGDIVAQCPQITIRGIMPYLYDSKSFSIFNDYVLKNFFITAKFINSEFSGLTTSVYNMIARQNGEKEYPIDSDGEKLLGINNPYRAEMWMDVNPNSNMVEVTACMYLKGNPSNAKLKKPFTDFLMFVMEEVATGKIYIGYRDLNE